MGVPKLKLPNIRLPKVKFHESHDGWETYNAMDPTKKYQYRDVYKGQQLERMDWDEPETMTSRLIMIGVLSIIVMIIVWYMIGLAQFAGSAFTGSVQSAASSGNSGVVSTETGDNSSQAGQDGQVGQIGPDGQISGQISQPAEPKSMEEFRQMQGMDFDTYLATYYQMVSAENSALHWYLSSITGDTYDWAEIYYMWEEITRDNYAAYMAMYNGSSDESWKDGDADNYVQSDAGNSNNSNNSNNTSGASGSSDTSVGNLSIGGVTLKSYLGKITFWKVFLTLMAGLLTWAIMYPIMKRNWETQNGDKDYRELLTQYVNDQHIQVPEEIQRNYDYFPDVGAHSPVQVSSMISHVMLLNKGVKHVQVVRRADSDIFDEKGNLIYYKGEVLLDDDGEPIVDECPMFDKDFGYALFDSAKVLDDKRARVFYNPTKIPYNPENGNCDKLKSADTVSEMINKYWSFPDYEPQRPAGAYLVDTAPVNTMI